MNRIQKMDCVEDPATEKFKSRTFLVTVLIYVALTVITILSLFLLAVIYKDPEIIDNRLKPVVLEEPDVDPVELCSSPSVFYLFSNIGEGNYALFSDPVFRDGYRLENSGKPIAVLCPASFTSSIPSSVIPFFLYQSPVTPANNEVVRGFFFTTDNINPDLFALPGKFEGWTKQSFSVYGPAFSTAVGDVALDPIYIAQTSYFNTEVTYLYGIPTENSNERIINNRIFENRNILLGYMRNPSVDAIRQVERLVQPRTLAFLRA